MALKLSFFLLILSASFPAFSCDITNLRRILRAGGHITVGNECSSYAVRHMAEEGADQVTVTLAGFTGYEAKQIAEAGVYLTANAADLSAYDMRRVAEEAKHRLTVTLAGYSTFDARRIVEEGASFYLDSSFSTYDARLICQEIVSPAQGWFYTDGFSSYDVRQISEAGCSAIGTGGELTFSRAKEILENGGYLEISDEFSAYDTRRLVEVGKERLTVNLSSFSPYDARGIVEKGASFYLDHSFSAYDVRRVCEALVPPARGQVRAEGFSNYDQTRIVEAGCGLF